LLFAEKNGNTKKKEKTYFKRTYFYSSIISYYIKISKLILQNFNDLEH